MTSTDATGTEPGTRVFWPTLRRMLGITRDYRKALWISIGLAAVAQGLALVIPVLTGAIVDTALKPHDQSALIWLSLAIVGIGLLRMVLMIARRLIAGSMAVTIEYDLRNLFYAHLQRLSAGFYDRNQTGQLMSRATADVGAVRIFLSYGLLFFTQHLLTVVAVTVMLFVIQPTLAVVAALMAPVLVLIAVRYSRRSHPVLKDVQQRLADVTTQAEENVSGVRVVKAFGQEQHEVRQFSDRSESVFAANLRANRQRSLYIPLMAFVPGLAVAVVLLGGGLMVANGTMNLGSFITFNLLLGMVVMPLRMLGMWIGQSQRAVASGVRVFEILDTEPEVVEPDEPAALPDGPGRIVLRDVRFGYDPARPVLDGIDLEIAGGATVALIGPTGSGKTTLSALIPRFYDVDAGAVEIDGADVRELRLYDLRQAVGIVSQDTFLFSASIRENIAFGRPDASDEQVRDAARRAQAAEFIEALPEQYDTVIGERGVTLSGGQRQRIAIARALIMDPRILILDDATASVDATTEARIKQALAEVMKDRTTIIIAHRLSTIALAERIVVLDHGAIADSGTDAELYERSAPYRQIRDHGLAEQTFVDLDGDRVLAQDADDDEDPEAALTRRSQAVAD